jgi:hypothetical protein
MQLVLTFEGTPAPTYTFTFTKVMVIDHSNPIQGPKEELMEEVSLKAAACTLVVTNWPTAEPTRFHA